MRAFAACLIGVALGTGCGNPMVRPHVMHDLGIDYRDHFIAELKKLGTYVERGTYAGGGETAFSSTLQFEVEGASAKDLDVLVFGDGVLAKWGKQNDFASHGGGGGGGLFSTEFGNDGNYAFIDVVSNPTDSGREFVFMIRAIE